MQDSVVSDPSGRYSRVAIALHWLTAAAFAFQIGLGWQLGGPNGPQTFAAFQLHKSVGITILLLTLARLAWRLTHRPPALPDLPAIERLGASAVHTLFYIFLICLPLSGWLIVSSSKVAIPTFLYGAIPWPHFPVVATLAPAAKESVNQTAGTAHELMVWQAKHLGANLSHICRVLQRTDARVHVRRQRDEPHIGEPAGDVAFVLDQSKGFVQHDHRRIRTRRFRPRQIALHLKSVAWKGHIAGFERIRIRYFASQCHNQDLRASFDR